MYFACKNVETESNCFGVQILKMVEKMKTEVDIHSINFFLETSNEVLEVISQHYVRFYLFYDFPNFENNILCILDTNM